MLPLVHHACGCSLLQFAATVVHALRRTPACVVLQAQGPEDESKGVEMEQDFDGEMHDVPENPQGDDEDAPEEEGGDERLEQEMGEGEEDDEVVDEKLWGEDEERPNDPDAKTEKDAPMKVLLASFKAAPVNGTCPSCC